MACARDWRKCCSTKPCTRPIEPSHPVGSVVQPPLDVRRPRPLRGQVGRRQPETILDLVVDAFRQLELRGRCRALGAKPWSAGGHLRPPTVATVLHDPVTQSVESGFLATGSFLQDLALDVQAHHLRQAPEGTPPCSRLSKTAKPCAGGRDLGRQLMRPVSASHTQFLPNPEATWPRYHRRRGQLRVGTVIWRRTARHVGASVGPVGQRIAPTVGLGAW